MHARLPSNRIAVLVFLILFPWRAAAFWAQAPSPVPAKSCLWKISSKQGTLYLLGSIHLLKKEAYPLNKAIENAFSNAERLVLEVNLEEMNSQDAQRLLLSKGLLAGGRTLQQSLSKESFALVNEKLETLGLPLEAVQRLKPWFLMLTLAVTKLQQLGYDPTHGIDRYFYEKAKLQSKEVLGLESAEFQIDLLDGLPVRTQEAALLQTLKEMEVMEKEFDQIVRAWAAGDTKGLEDSLLQSFQEYPEVYEKILTARNRNWLPKIEELLQQPGNTLVVVGAAHLVGPAGVVQLLRKKGYTVEQQ